MQKVVQVLLLLIAPSQIAWYCGTMRFGANGLHLQDAFGVP